jgi:glucose-6-phosphate isomerase
MEVPPPAEDSLKFLAETVEIMKRAEASSLRVRVSVLHPDWDDSEIDAEIERIQNESSIVDPLTFGMGGSGIDVTDPLAP